MTNSHDGNPNTKSAFPGERPARPAPGRLVRKDRFRYTGNAKGIDVREVVSVTGFWRNWLARWQNNPYLRRPPLLLLNGLAEQAESWFRNLPFWRHHFDVYAPNLLVYDGPSLHQRIDEGLPISVEYLVEQLHHYLEAFVQRPPYHLVAASLGGKIAVEYAARYPDRVKRIVLLCPSGMGDEERLPIVDGVRRNDPRSIVESVFYEPDRLDPRLLLYYQRQFANRRWRLGLLRTVRGTMDHCIRARLSELPHPTLLVSGREDKIVDPNTTARAVTLLPCGEYLCIPQCGHAPQLERPWLINRLVVQFLTSTQPCKQMPLLGSLPTQPELSHAA
jgi:pimeloyl-ACP methyl ester carboxylesterase